MGMSSNVGVQDGFGMESGTRPDTTGDCLGHWLVPIFYPSGKGINKSFLILSNVYYAVDFCGILAIEL